MLRKILLALALVTGAPAAMAATCSVDIEGNDMMKYSVANIDVSKGARTSPSTSRTPASWPGT